MTAVTGTALVTGAGRGLGAAIARTLAARIRNTRMGNGLGGGVSIPEMIEEDRR